MHNENTTSFQLLSQGDGAVFWVKSEPNKVKISVNAVVFEDRDGIELCLVTRDDFNGELIKTTAKFEHSFSDSN